MAKNPKLIDMTGSTYGNWFVIEQAGNTAQGCALWLCRCVCGSEKIVRGPDIRNGKSMSCGCQSSRITLGKRSITHGLSKSRLYYCWKNMRARCSNVANKSYGGKGITVCAAWNSFDAFKEWAYTSGYSDSLTIERVNNDLGYSPENCRWATRKDQARNRSIVRMFDANTSWAEIAERNGVPVTIMNNRIASGGWPIELAATTPVGSTKDGNQHDDLGRFVKKPSKSWRR